MGAADEFARIEAEFPAWEWWRGVNGQLYARRPKSSPPKVVRADDAAALLERIRAAERRA